VTPETTRDDVMVLDGVVAEVHRGGFFEVDVAAGAFRRRVRARLGGKLTVSKIRVIPGDRVRVEVSCYDPTRGRITYRHR
jgi:translation initiation factor IF-1